MPEAAAFQAAWGWALAGDERALEHLERLGRDPESVNARVEWFEVLLDPAFDDLRDDPRYLALMETFGM